MSTRDHPDWWRPVGGQNSQDSVLERRSLVWNDNGVVAPVAPPANYTEVIYKGKFYPRGMRGMIELLQIYCIRTGVGTLTLRYSPHPCLGPIGEVTITPGAAWAWVGVAIEEMWDYDSLFIWVHTCSVDVSWGYDAVLPYDGHWSTDLGATWEALAIRPFIRVVYTGETPGDVPVSGIINNIRIPNASSEELVEAQIVPLDTWTSCVAFDGIGHCDLVIVHVWASALSHNTQVEIQCDGVRAFRHQISRFNMWTFGNDTQPIVLPLYVEDGACVLMLTKMWEFQRRFEVLLWNQLAAQTATVYTYPSLLR